ncbi:MAG TPA: hypothetical protein DCE42_30745 [Myxococcales bacterium]|nr:hypothetical protein [Deltaproteobacteria bacterium]MBU49730.1 hypothetical protein [Deltaproteobacteria bacterium]HAA59167.1 hypothetical protein [Myxococcales bacterium]
MQTWRLKTTYIDTFVESSPSTRKNEKKCSHPLNTQPHRPSTTTLDPDQIIPKDFRVQQPRAAAKSVKSLQFSFCGVLFWEGSGIVWPSSRNERSCV